jgi:hypothetical protein
LSSLAASPANTTEIDGTIEEEPREHRFLRGELQKWHKITLGFVGSFASEMAIDNPFTNYLLNVTYTHNVTGKTYLVPGYFAADGNAANSGASSGIIKMVGKNVIETSTNSFSISCFCVCARHLQIIHDSGTGSPAGAPHSLTGSFNVQPTNKNGRDHRGKGRLTYVGEHHCSSKQVPIHHLLLYL